ncbi:MAG: NUDIX domain-containing protein [Planctomycetota bacterium]|nr:NUDIX domain-containing protein [Planctomycetota bacterium]
MSKDLKVGVLGYLYSDGRTCMLKKRENGHYMDGHFVAPGGKREENESLEDALVREVREETGVTPTAFRLTGILHFPDSGDSPFGAEWLCFIYVFTEYEGEFFPDGPEGKVVQVGIEELGRLDMWPGDEIFTPHVFEDGVFSARFVYDGQELVEHSISQIYPS